MFKKFTLTCDEATAICDKSQYKEATFIEKLKLNWHLFRCKICVLYVKQNRTMSKVFKINAVDCKKKRNCCLSHVDKESLKIELKKI